jgi:hypothetical protein
MASWSTLRVVVTGGVAALVVASCSSSPGGAAAVRESAEVVHAENLLAAYAAPRAGLGLLPTGCEARIFGERTVSGGRQVYAELMCSNLLGRPPCPSSASSAFDTTATATISTDGAVNGFLVDMQNDSGYVRWISDHIPAQWQHLERTGTTYGALLQARLTQRYPCPTGTTPLP